jgi:hypothetical protein
LVVVHISKKLSRAHVASDATRDQQS